MPIYDQARSEVTYEGGLMLVERKFFAGPHNHEIWIELYTSARSRKPVARVTRLGLAWHMRASLKSPTLTPKGRKAKYQADALGVRFQTRHEALAAAIEHARAHIERRASRKPRRTP